MAPVSAADIRAGSVWTYRAPVGYETSRIVVGALVRFDDAGDIACIAVTAAPQRRADGSMAPRDIPFLPLTVDALLASVVAPDGQGANREGFEAAFEAWRKDERGLAFFTVPFDGHLDRMIARQMASLSLPNAG